MLRFSLASLTRLSLCILALTPGCLGGRDKPSPPDASRPVVRSEAELARERLARIERGDVVVNEPPDVRSRPEAERPPPPPPLVQPEGAFRGDLLIVNDAVLTVSEVIYMQSDAIEALRQEHPGPSLLNPLSEALITATRQEVGTILLYQKAGRKLTEPQKAAFNATVDREIADRIAREFQGSQAKWAEHLRDHDLTPEQYRELVSRRILVRGYMREVLGSRVQVTRDDLIQYYEAHAERYSTPETRELLLIELPFAAFLPEGVSWEGATVAQQRRAKLRALQAQREAMEALRDKSFADVAAAFSKGPHAADGGSWGQIGKPLQPPYQEASAKIFEAAPGAPPEAVETSIGWCIVKLGSIVHATRPSFRNLQDRVRREIEDERFQELATTEIVKLAQRASISGLEAFVQSAIERIVPDAFRSAARATAAVP